MSRSRLGHAIWIVSISAYIVIGALATYAWQQGPRGGLDVDFAAGSAVVTRVLPGAPAWDAGVRPGDQLIQLAGQPISQYAWAEHGEFADSFLVRMRGGEKVFFRPGDEAVPGTSAVVGLHVTGAAFAFIGLFVLARTFHTPQVLAFSLYVFGSAIAIIAAPGAATGHAASFIVVRTALHWVPVVFLAFLSGFDTHDGDGRPGSVARWVLFIAGIALTLDLLAALAFTSVFPEVYDLATTIAPVFAGAVLLGGIVMLFRRYFSSSSPVFREQTRVITVGIGLGLIPLIALNLFPFATGVGHLVPPEFTVIATIAIPLSFAYATMRHELMGIRRLVHRGVAYALISVGVLIVYAGVVTVTRIITGADGGDASPVSLTLLIVLLAGVPLLPRVQTATFELVNKLLYRDFVNHREVVRQASFTALETSSVPQLAEDVLEKIQEPLGLEFAAYIEVTGGHREVVSSVGDVSDEHILELTAAQSTPAATTPRTRLLDLPSTEGQILLADIPGLGTRPGLMFLGPRETGEPFRDDDVEMIQTIAGLASTAVARIELLDQLQGKNEELQALNSQLVSVEEQERARVSAYLHDEPLQKVSYALRQYRMRHEQGEDLAGLLSEAVSELRSVSATLSPSVLSDLGLVRALEWLLSQADSRAPFSLHFNLEGIERDERFDQTTELVAYRVVQEALTNCQKHSDATAVWVELEADEHELAIAVNDNGRGSDRRLGNDGNRPDSLGLRSMRQRVESLGGRLIVGNRRSRGFGVEARLPIERRTPGKTVGLQGAAA